MKSLSLVSRPDSLLCPLCESGGLRPWRNGSMRCGSCGGHVGGAMLETLRRITDLPDALGSHTCDCGHPEMRRLPDGTHHCPSCGSEVLPMLRRPFRSLTNAAKRGGLAGWTVISGT